MPDLLLGILSLVHSIPSYFVKLLPNVRSPPRTYDGPFPDSPALSDISGSRCPCTLLVGPCFLISEMNSLEWSFRLRVSGDPYRPLSLWHNIHCLLFILLNCRLVLASHRDYILVDDHVTFYLIPWTNDGSPMLNAERVPKKMVSIPDLCCLYFLLSSHTKSPIQTTNA